MTSDVIEEVRGKRDYFVEDSGHFYKFVTKPGLFNFVGDENSTPCKSKKSSKSVTPASSLGKRKRKRNDEEMAMDYDGTWFSNEHASTSCDEESFQALATPTRDNLGGLRGSKFNGMGSSAGQNLSLNIKQEVSPAKRCRKGNSSVSGVSALQKCAEMEEEETDPAVLAKVWKELTLNR